MTVRWLSLVVALLAPACSSGPTPPGTFPVANDGGMVAASAEAIRDFVTSGGTSDWVREPAPHGSSGPHGLVQSSFNDAYVAARRADKYPMPVGAASVKELFEDGGAHKGWAVGIKTAAGDGADTWTWWETTSPSNETVAHGSGIYSCERCHGDSSRDRSLTPTVP